MEKIKKQKGFTLIELMIVLGIIVMLTIAAWPKIEQMFGVGDAAKVRAQITEIQNGSHLYKARNNVMTNVSMTVLDSQGYISSNMGDGASRNPWGGDYRVTVDATDVSRYVVTVTGVRNSKIGAQLAGDYATTAVSSSFTGTTLTVVFQG